eukprot:TRINITY_DN17171_c0_g2_i3.p1 TRINITY_DN17171_c0_g2~~TRINITY_DN17171_c0_g2_i3.p1  ORF type:complete len:622 (+),score=120.00 TRINITY_DN17171_c0_g2_i3:230-2095(+)
MAASALFNPAYHVGASLLSSGLLPEAWKACCSAYGSKSSFHVTDCVQENRVCIAFPSNPLFYEGGGEFGECEVGHEDFPFGLLRDKAVVHHGVFKQFLHVYQEYGLCNEVKAAQNKKKMIVFTGHSFGGAVAALATLSYLEKKDLQNPVFCVTFGCPLFGDATLSKVIHQKRWHANYCHLVLSHDIIPRVLLAPLKQTQGPLQNLYHNWLQQMIENKTDSQFNMAINPLLLKQFSELYFTVMQFTSEAITYNNGMEEDTLNDGISLDYRLSPFRPFGYYMFCTKNGAVCVDNSEDIMHMFLDTLKGLEPTSDIQEHTHYGSCLTNIIKNVVEAPASTKLALRDPLSAFEVGTFLQLSILGVKVEKSFQLAIERKQQWHMKCKRLEDSLSQAQKAMTELEWYRKVCRNEGVGYYDSFKQHNTKGDHRANLHRKRLADFWDGILKMLEEYELPDRLCESAKWMYAATTYRLLVEPLDIAYFYSHGHHEIKGQYLMGGRSSRYWILEQWCRDKILAKKKSRKICSQSTSLTQDSCFWAHVEELSYSLERNPAEAMPKLKEFENRVKHLIEANELSSEVFLDGSSFVKWWKNLPDCYKQSSPLHDIMEGGWKLYYDNYSLQPKVA